MAKQSGLHQIRGKVGEHSYYRQTGVASGLIRSINQGMSSRVKTGDEYANTRLNNAEFGQAGSIAKALGRLIVPKYRPMILPFSQSKMAKSLLSAIKSDSAPWGQRNLSSDLTERVNALVSALNDVSKGDFDDFGITVRTGELNQLIVEATNPNFESKLRSIGADSCNINVVMASPAIGKWTTEPLFGAGTGYAPSSARANYDNDEISPDALSFTVAPNFPPSAPEGAVWMSANFLVIIVMPLRDVNGDVYVLQEHCTYKAMAIPA